MTTPLPSTPHPVPPERPPVLASPSPGNNYGHWALVLLILSLTCLMLRLTGMMALPIFGDEAIYLRWAQLIRGDSAGVPHLWVSLADPKPPLHFWMIAGLFKVAADPLVPARFISVLAGVLSVPLFFAVGCETGRLIRLPSTRTAHPPKLDSQRTENSLPPPTGRSLGLLAAILMIFCPFFAFYQRLATADALFAAESLVILWLSLLWARLSLAKSGRAWLTALFLGMAIGVALLTRQGISYTLCAMPAIAWCLHLAAAPSAGRVFRSRFGPSVVQLTLAAALAAALWAPYLAAELHVRTLANKSERSQLANPPITDADYTTEIKRRILYQDKFTDSRDSRVEIARRNLHASFFPTRNAAGVPTSGWLYFYLTPGVYVACLLGLIYLALRGQWLVLILLALWLILTLGPVILLGNVVYSRYILAGVPPLLIAAAYLLADGFAFLFRYFAARPPAAWAVTIAALIALFIPPLRDIGLQSSRWWRQTLTAQDNYQYVSGWTSGLASARAITEIRRLAREGPLLVITGNEWGTPADALWVYLSGKPNIRIFYTDQAVIGGGKPQSASTPPGASTPTNNPPALWLRNDKWLWPAYGPVEIPENVPILYVTQAMWGGTPSIDRLKKENPNLVHWQTFNGLEHNGLSDPDGAVSVFKLIRPAAGTAAP